MKIIYKYEIGGTGVVTGIMMPVSAEILTAQIDKKNGKVHIWVLLETNEVQTTRFFTVEMTGDSLDHITDELKFINTVQFRDGAFIVHVFEIIKKDK